MDEMNVTSWLVPAHFSIKPINASELATRLSSLPRSGSVEAICKAITALDLGLDSMGLERDFLSLEIVDSLNRFRQLSNKPHVIFHLRQLFLLLALVIRHSDSSVPCRDLTESDRFALGEACLHVNNLFQPDSASKDWKRNPVGSEIQQLLPDLFFSLPPGDGFMSVFRSSRILMHAIPEAEKQLKLPMGAVHEQFGSYFGLSLEQAWTLVAMLCQNRYPVSGRNPMAPIMDVTNIASKLGWKSDEVQSFKNLAVSDLETISNNLPLDPLADFASTFAIFMDSPILAIHEDLWWSHGPFLSDRILRTFHSALLDSSPDKKTKGDVGNIFGLAVELYVQELLDLANSGKLDKSSLQSKRADPIPKWYKRNPDFEVGRGMVRQLIEIKSQFFPPSQVFMESSSTLINRIETNLLSDTKGIGQLASYAVGRYASLGTSHLSRLQAVLIVLEQLPVLVPGAQQAAYSEYSRHFDSYLARAASKWDSIPILGTAHRQVVFLSIEEFEYIVSYTTVGHELKDTLDALSNHMQGVLLPAKAILERILTGPPPSRNWLGSAYDELFEKYDRNFR